MTDKLTEILKDAKSDDVAAPIHKGTPADGGAWRSGVCDIRVVRGGSWGSDPRFLRSADRGGLDTGFRYNRSGFRVARMLD